MSITVKSIEDLLRPRLKEGQKIISCDFKKLLSSGENYGSVMLSISVEILDESGEISNLHCVGKTVPPNEILKKLFNTAVTFKKEIAVYKVILPELNEYGRKLGIPRLIDFLPECLGARISLDPNSVNVDEDAVLVLENLKVQGYDVCDRYAGFDEDTSKVILKDLATVHAAVIGYQKSKPEEFKSKFLPFLNKDYRFDITESFAEEFAEAIQKVCSKNHECVPLFPKINNALNNINYFNSHPTEGKEIFKTLVHNDMWVNNALLKFDQGNILNKIVDFQVIEYSSLAHDVIFFLYSSVNMDVLEEKVDELIKFYYEKFIEILKSLECDIGCYHFESFMEELKIIARDAEFSHLLYMMTPILMLKKNATELSEFKFEDLLFDESSVNEIYLRRVPFILLDFAKKGWI